MPAHSRLNPSRISCVLGFVLLLPTAAFAQSPVPGSFVRVHSQDRTVDGTQGTVRDTTNGMLEIEVKSTRTLITPDGRFASYDTVRDVRRIPIASVERAEVVVGHKRHVLKGLGIGVLAGGALGGGLGYTAGNDGPCPQDLGWGCLGYFTRGETAAQGAVAFGVLGGVVGTLIGLLRSDVWAPLPLGRTVQVAPTGVSSVAIRVSFGSSGRPGH